MNYAWLAALDSTLWVRLTLALLHFLWLGGAVAIVTTVAARLLRQRDAHSRYLVNVGGLLAMATCLPAAFVLTPVPQAEQPRPSVLAEAAAPAPILAEAPLTPAASLASTETRAEPLPNVPLTAGPRETARNAGAVKALPPATISLLESTAPFVAAAYLLGVALMMVRLVLALCGGKRLSRSARMVEDRALLANLARQARRLGIAVVPALGWCERIAAPVVVGIVRPMILLPASLASGLDEAQLAALLAHELAHIRRFDLLVNLLQRLIEAALFFHPAVWYLSRHVSIERENACDDLVLSAGWPRVAYADALVRMAELCARSRSIELASHPALLAASGESPSQFKRRVLRLLGQEPAPALVLNGWGVAALLTATSVLLLAPFVVETLAGNQVETAPVRKQPRVAAEKQLANVAWGETTNGLQFGLSFSEGNSKFRVGQKIAFAVHARNKSDKAINLRYGWPSVFGVERKAERVEIFPMFVGGQQIMEEVALKPGEERELPGAEQHNAQELLLAPRDWKATGEPFVILEPMTRAKLVSTNVLLVDPEKDSDWRGKAATGELAFDVLDAGGKLHQVDEAAWGDGVTWPVAAWKAPPLPKDWTREELWTRLTKRLLALTERELRPYAFEERDGVMTIQYRTREQHVWRPTGKIGVPLVRREETGPRADGLMLEMWLSDGVAQAARPQTLETDPWRTFLGQVDLPELKTRLMINVSYGHRTDRKLLTRFVAPRDWLAAAAPKNPGTLVEASVVDAGSGRPLMAFRVIPGTPYGLVKGPDDPAPAVWQPHLLREAKDGAFEWPSERSYEQFRLRFEADDYIPELSPWIKKAEGPKVIEIKLRKDPGIEGRVLLPDGKPAAGAVLAIAMPNREVRMESGKLKGADDPLPEKPGERWRRPIVVKANDEGRYRLPTEPSAAMVYVLHESGVAEVGYAALAKSTDISLAGWGSIDGRVLWNDKPGAEERLFISIMREASGYPVCSYSHSLTTDKEGRFRVEKLPPWKVQISRTFDLPSGRGFVFPNLHVDLAAGKPTEVVLGGKGRPVTGKLAGLASYEGVTLSIAPNAPRPGDKSGWEGHAMIRASNIGPIFFRDKLPVNKDGTFRIDNVLPAYYQLFVRTDDNSVFAGRQLSVPSPAAEKPDEPVDAGEIKVARRPPNGAAAAPAKEARDEKPSAEMLARLGEPGVAFAQDAEEHVVSITVGGKASDDWLAKIKSLPRLKKLYIETSRDVTARGVAHIAEIRSLESLEFYSVPLPDAALASLAGVPKLLELSVTEARLTDAAMPHVGALTGLKKLRLRGNQITDAGMEHLTGLRNLEVLDVAHGNWVESRMRISDAGILHLAGLTKLRELDIAGLGVGDEGFARLGGLTELRSLNLGGTQITGKGLVPLAKFTKLESLMLAGPLIDDAGMEHVAKCGDLAYLSLSYAKVGDEGLRQVAKLPELSRITLDTRFITDAGLAHLVPLAKLDHIELRASNTSDEGLRHLSHLPSLTRLDLSGSGEPGVSIGRNYTEKGYAHLAKAKKLKTFYLTNAEVMWTELRELKQLETLSMMMPSMSQDDVRALQKAVPDTYVSAAWGGGSIAPAQLFDEKGSFIGPRKGKPRKAAAADAPVDNSAIKGRVIDAKDKPVAGAKVEILPYVLEPTSVLGTSTTDEAGRFEYPGEAPEKDVFYVQVSKPGYVTERHIGNYHVHLTSDGQLVPDEFTLTRNVTLSGKVLGPDGKPLAGVPLAFDFIHDRMASINSRRFKSDAKGEYRLEGLPAGELFVRYSRYPAEDDPVPEPARFFVAHVQAEDGDMKSDVNIDFSKAVCKLEGQVVGADGKGVPEAHIKVAHGFSAQRLDHTVHATTDKDGKFRLNGLPPDEFSVFASGRRGGLGEGVTVKLSPDKTAEVKITGYTPGRAPPRDRRVEPSLGKTHEGLQAALVIEPAKAEYGRRETIDVRMLVRNVSEKPIDFIDTLSFNALHVTGPDEKKQRLDFRHFTGLPWSEFYRLEPGHEVLLKGSFNAHLAVNGDSGSGRGMFKLIVEPGACYRMMVTFGNGFESVDVPPKDRLVSGEATLKIARE